MPMSLYTIVMCIDCNAIAIQLRQHFVTASARSLSLTLLQEFPLCLKFNIGTIEIQPAGCDLVNPSSNLSVADSKRTQ
jgi:hypothetical protein